MREQVSIADKVALGRCGAALIKPGQVVILDGGTTALQVARHLAPGLRATIVTHSPTVAIELAEHAGIEILVLGGRLFRHSMVNVGADVIDAASRLRADLFFLGVTGVHPDAGLSTGDAEEAAVKRALHERAAETVVLASPEKLMAASPFVVAPLAAISLLAVPRGTPARVTRALRAGGVQIARDLTSRCVPARPAPAIDGRTHRQQERRDVRDHQQRHVDDRDRVGSAQFARRCRQARLDGARIVRHDVDEAHRVERRGEPPEQARNPEGEQRQQREDPGCEIAVGGERGEAGRQTECRRRRAG